MSDVEDLYELSPLQQGMLFHALSDTDTRALYLLQLDCALRGPLDASSFARAWQQTADRHPALRTSFHWKAVDKPLQVVNRRVELRLRQEDWAGLSPVEQQARLEALAEDQRRAFDLRQAPLMRLALIRLGEREYRLVWTFHHIVLEGRSALLVLDDVAALYGSLRRGEAIQPETSRPYRDYILWLQQQDLSQAEPYWRKALEGVTAPTPLGVDRPVPGAAVPPAGYADATAALPASASDALRSLAKRQRLTVNTCVQGAWALLLSRYSGLRDVVFGSVVSGRPPSLAGAQSMVGLFVNTLAARVRVDEDERVGAWLEQLQRQQAEMREYEYSSLVDVQGWSEVPRGRPLFESILIFQNWQDWLGDDGFRSFADEVEIGDMRWFDGPTGYPLIIHVIPGNQLFLKAAFDRSRFEAAAIERLLTHFSTLLGGMVSDPGVRVSELPLLSASERSERERWNRTGMEHGRGLRLPDLVEGQVARTPEAVAVECDGQPLTYGQLNGRANGLAHELRKLGVGPGVLVGIYMERSVEMLVGLLGVLKAGGAYVPLDPDYPKERVSYMLEDSGAAVLLTQGALRGSLPGRVAKVVCVDEVDRFEAANLERLGTSDDLAYVIYTSGSTGRPKGVEVTHRGLVNLLLSMREQPGLDEHDVLLSVTTISFDMAVPELYLPLLVGGRLVLAGREVAVDGAELMKRLGEGVTVFQATPSTWRLLLEAGWRGDGKLRIWCGAEAWTLELADELLARGSSVWNLYGPTETTVWSARGRVEAGALTVSPISNTQVYLLDRRLRPVPIGVAGEVYIGGEGLARGYLGRPELTGERFVPDPFTREAGARLYRTGDLARYRPDGSFEVLGRVDHQVKVRGFRIELGEIESVLNRHAGMQAAVVIVKESAPGDRELVAYVVHDSGSEPTVTELRDHLKASLPAHMVPSAFVFLDRIPLMPNGKVDRRALERVDGLQQRAQQAYVAPRTPMEKLLAGIWGELLGVDQISIRDNFFDLGGHSLMAMKVIHRLERSVGHRLNPRDIIFQTLEQLAGMCDVRSRLVGNKPRRGIAMRLFEAVRDAVEGLRPA